MCINDCVDDFDILPKYLYLLLRFNVLHCYVQMIPFPVNAKSCHIPLTSFIGRNFRVTLSVEHTVEHTYEYTKTFG